MRKVAIPDWLKNDPVVFHLPDRTIFEPQRRIVRFNQQPYLLDCCNRRYAFAHCDRLRPEYLKGMALWVTENQPLTVFRLNSQGDLIAVTDGTKKAIVRLPQQTPERAAAESLALFFNGEVISDAI